MTEEQQELPTNDPENPNQRADNQQPPEQPADPPPPQKKLSPQDFFTDSAARQEAERGFEDAWETRTEIGKHIQQDQAKFKTIITGENIQIQLGDLGMLSPTAEGTAPFRFWHIAAQTLTELQEVFVPPETCERAKETLRRDRVVIMQDIYGYYEGPHLAIKVLMDMFSDSQMDTTLYALDPRYPLRELADLIADDKLPKGGYLIENHSPEPFVDMDSSDMEFMTAKLRQKGAFLIITTNHRAYLDLKGRERFTIHVQFEDFPDDQKPVYTPETGLRAIMHWFEENRSPGNADDRIYLTALAMLSRCEPYLVHEGYERLKVYLEYEPPEDLPPAILDEPLQQRLDRMKAARVTESINTEYGLTDVQVLVFPRYGYRQSLLWYLWEQFDRQQEQLVAWMHEMILRPETQIRRAIGEAIGLLATRNFSAMVNHILRPLAKGGLENPPYHHVLGIALWVAAKTDQETLEEKTIAPAIRKLLRHWATQNNLSMRLAAVVGYQWAGEYWPLETLKTLNKMVESAESGIDQLLLSTFTLPIVHALRSVAHDRWHQDEQPSNLQLVIRLLKMANRWVENRKVAIKETGATLFAFLALTEVRHDTSEFGDEGEKEGRDAFWPLPLEAAFRSDGGAAQALGHLLGALARRFSREDVYAILTHWLWMNVGNKDEDMAQVVDPRGFYDTLRDVIRAMLTSAANPAQVRRECAHFDRQLQRWQRQRGKIARIAARLQEDLTTPLSQQILPRNP